MLYLITKFLVNIFYRVFYSVEYSGTEYVSGKKQPIVLAPNHSNAFIDPIIAGMCLKQKVRFFARGDVFKSKTARYFLDILNVSPIYRMSEGGISAVKKNDATIEECKARLRRNETIMIFPEGICIQHKKISPLRKGLAKIVFAAAEENDFKNNILIVPVGINYAAPSKMRSKVFVEYGKPISIKEFEEKYKADKAKSINEFTAFFQPKLEEVNVVINNTANEQLAEGIVEIKRHDLPKPISPKEELLIWRNTAKKINHLENSNPELFEKTKTGITTYITELHKMKLRDHLLRKENVERITLVNMFFELIIVSVTLPFYFIGVLINYPPYWLAQKLAEKKAKTLEFFSSIHANAGMLLWLIWFKLHIIFHHLIIGGALNTFIYSVFIIASLPFTIWVHPKIKKSLGRVRLLRYVKKQREKIEDLFLMRQLVIDLIEKNNL